MAHALAVRQILDPGPDGTRDVFEANCVADLVAEDRSNFLRNSGSYTGCSDPSWLRASNDSSVVSPALRSRTTPYNVNRGTKAL